MKAPAIATAILVLGMHRSGTSVLTRLISLCGAGLPKNLLGPVPGDNERGFWESLPLIELNDQVLTAAGRVWHDLRPIAPEWFASSEGAPFVGRLARLIQAEFGDAKLLVIKDPRICRLLPLYQAALAEIGVRPVALIPLRNPLEVAASLHVRDGLGMAKGVLLWLDHVMAAERASRGLQRCFTTFDQAIDDPGGLMTRIGRSLEISWPRPPAVAGADIAAFLAPALRHQRREDADFSGAADLPDEIKDAYSWLAQAATAGAAPPHDALDRLAARLARQSVYWQAVAELEAAARDQDARLKHWIDAAVKRYGMIEHLQREVARLNARSQPLWRRIFKRAAADH